MRNQQSPEQSTGLGALGWILFISRALSVSVEVFLHRVDSFGERYLGFHSAVALLIIFFFPIFCEGQDPTPLLWFLGAYCFMCICIMARIQKRRRRAAPQPHSLYSGFPILLRASAARHEQRFKALVEPMVVWLAGAVLLTVSIPLGSYVLVAGLGLAISVGTALSLERKRALDLHDAFIEQRNIAERFRNFRGE